MHLPLWLRKKIMYNLITVVPEKITFVKTSVIASRGEIVDSAEAWLCSCTEDSTGYPLPGTAFSTKDVREAEDRMARSLDYIYTKNCDHDGEEGLVFKDVNSPYAIGHENRSKGYWYKV
jgi:hypothetical protein